MFGTTPGKNKTKNLHFRSTLLKVTSLLLFTGLMAISPAQDKKVLQKVVIALHWQPQTQFAGYYTALIKGIYKKYGLDVVIRPTGLKDNAVDLLKSGDAQFMTNFLSMAIEEYDKGLNLKLIAQTSQKSALCIAGLKSRGINKLSDLNGKKISIWQVGFRELPQAFLTKYKINASFVPIRSSVNLFLMGGTNAQVVMDYNELNTIIFSGIREDDITLFRIADYGLNVPEDGIYCTSEYLSKHKDICERFVKATAEGWIEAFKNKEEAVRYCLKLKRKAGQSANYAHQMKMLTAMENIIQVDGGKLNTSLDRKSFELAVQVLKDAGRIKNTIKYDSFFNPVVR